MLRNVMDNEHVERNKAIHHIFEQLINGLYTIIGIRETIKYNLRMVTQLCINHAMSLHHGIVGVHSAFI